MELTFLENIDYNEAMIAKLSDHWVTVTESMIRGQIQINKHLDMLSVFVYDRFLSIEVLYNATDSVYYIEWNEHGIYRIPPRGVVDTYIASGIQDEMYQEHSYGFYSGGRYFFDEVGVRNNIKIPFRKDKIKSWIEQAGCTIPTLVANMK